MRSIPSLRAATLLSLTLSLLLYAPLSHSIDLLNWMGMLGDSGKGKIAQLEFHLRDGYTPTAVVFSPDGQFVASAGAQARSIHIWDVRQRKLIKDIELPVSPSGGIHHLAWSPDGRYLAHCDAFQGGLRIYATSDWRTLQDFSKEDVDCTTLAFSSDSALLSAAGKNGVVTLATADWSVLRKLRFAAQPQTLVDVVSYVAGSHTLLLGGQSDNLENCTGPADRSGRIWVLAESDQALKTNILAYCAPNGGKVEYLASHPNGKQIATSTETNPATGVTDSVHVFSFPEGQQLATPLDRLGTQRPQALSYTANGKYLLVGMGDGKTSALYVVDTTSLQVLDTLHASGAIHDLTVDGKSSMIAAATGNGITIWKFK